MTRMERRKHSRILPARRVSRPCIPLPTERVGLQVPTRFALWHPRGIRRAHCRRHPARGRGLARVARAGASRRLERNRRHRHLPSAGLPVRWRTPIHAGYAGPAVAGGRVFVTDSRRIKANQAIERAVALDEQSGQHPLDARMGDELQRPAARVRDRSACDADRRRRSRLRARRDGTSARARREERPGALAEGLRRRLQCLRADLGHGRRAARRRRSA